LLLVAIISTSSQLLLKWVHWVLPLLLEVT
jgi:hypothetical protein